jgi:DNA polymerase-3 subunit epsilon
MSRSPAAGSIRAAAKSAAARAGSSSPGKRPLRVWAEQSPFDLKDALRRRGYRWCDGSDGRPRSWYVDIDESKLDDEIAFLRTEIFLRDLQPRLQTLTAFDRFSVRA